MVESKYAYKLTGGTVVDRTVLSRLSADDLGAAMADIYSDPSVRVIVVDNPTKFFSAESLFAAIDNNDPNLPLLIEQNGISITDNEINTIRLANATRQRIRLAIVDAELARRPPYVFADVPEGWSVATHLTLSPVHVSRKGAGNRRLGYRILEKMWGTASQKWVGNCEHVDVFYTPGSAHRVAVMDNSISVGCQSINRYELEQLALHRGWEFPTQNSKS